MEVLNINLSEDNSTFVVGHIKGFWVYDSSNFKLLVNREFKGGVGFIRIIENSNIFVLRGGGINPAFPIDKLILWDEDQNNVVTEVKFKSRLVSFSYSCSKILARTTTDVFLF